jgi:uncharacterized protein (DUF1800 family)
MRKAIAIRLLPVMYLVSFLALSLMVGGPVGLASKKSESAKTALTEDQRIIHLLNRAGFGPRPGEVEKVKQRGIQRYLEAQLRPFGIDDSSTESKLESLETLKLSSADLIRNYPRPKQNREIREGIVEEGQAPAVPSGREERRELRAGNLNGPRRVISELSQAKLLRAVYSDRQLYEVMVDFWTNHFNVFAAKGANKWLTTGYDRDVIRPHAMGKFKDLLVATAKSPAMLFYLDNWMSKDPNETFELSVFHGMRRNQRLRLRKGPGEGSRIRRSDRVMDEEDEPNFNKKVGETRKQKRGLNENYARELMELHTLGVDGGYTQKDITEVARCFTGWTIARPAQGGEFFFAKFLHDPGEKLVLGHKIPAGGGIRDGQRVLEILADHSSTAKFIATKLARRFVADEPPVSLVNRVAEVFRQTDGDVPAMLRSIFTSAEFNSSAAYGAKIKTPFELVVSAIRAVGAETDGGAPILQTVARMGEPLFLCQPPTGYSDTADAWVNTGALLHRLNFGFALAGNRLQGTRVDLADFAGLAVRDNEEAWLKRLGELILQNEVSEKTLAALEKQMRDTDSSEDEPGSIKSERLTGPAKIAGLLLGAPGFQRQ